MDMKMKLKLNKKKLKNLSKDNKALPANMTPQVGGGCRAGGGGRLTLDLVYTCGMGYTCDDIF